MFLHYTVMEQSGQGVSKYVFMGNGSTWFKYPLFRIILEYERCNNGGECKL